MNIFSRVWQSVVVASMILTPMVCAKITIYMCGDSTMQDWTEGYYPKRGIGQEFQYFWNSDNVVVVNKGAGGTAAMTYYNKNWAAVKSSLKSGDFVIIQFGINDRNYSNEEEFVTATTAMANEALAVGATPIIINPVRRSDYRCSMSPDKNKICEPSMLPDSIYESYHGYPIRAREIAASLNVPLIDMDTLSRNYLLSVGQYYALHYVNMVLDEGEYSTYVEGNNDNLHLQQNGATVFGRITTEQMRVHPNEKVRNLAKNLAPMYQVDVKVSPAGSAEATTVSSYYPAGMPVTLKTTPKEGKTFLGWFDGKGNKCANTVSTVKSEYICTFTMGTASTQYTAVYGGGQAQLYTGNGAALSSFPVGVPKEIEGVTPTGTVNVEDVDKINKDMKIWFDASEPDGFDVGWTENKNTGFSFGKGYWNFDNKVNTFASYEMEFPSAGYVTMGIIYSNGGSTSRNLNVYLDHDYLVDCPPTGDWTNYDTAFVNLDLVKGKGELKFISTTSDGGPNIDAFGFSVDNICRANDDNCEVVMGLRSEKLQLPSEGPALVSVYDMTGRLVAQKRVENAANISLSSMVKPAGLYRVLIRQGSARFSATWAKVK